MPAKTYLTSYSLGHLQDSDTLAIHIRLHIDITEQLLCVRSESTNNISYPISSAANGVGEINGSGCTPRGKHIIRAKIGAGQPINSIFIGRRPTGEIYHPKMCHLYPHRDWILTRILWLSGCQAGFNRLGNVDTMRRYIYIHGTPKDVKLGKPGSAGCIRMRNQDLLALYDRVEAGTNVIIHA